ncbi:acyl-CoA dehydrogenase family protein [Pseudonocardia nematodicida]|uniref:Acyl-CoA dehydrogenase family protein n=1 Tax=Pseudonocardia nematodicida TaxID=1206997 RepID=A0ABV1KJQ0_9PSEU
MTANPTPADPFAPDAGLAAHPAVVAAHEVAEGVLAPQAAEADDPARGVRREVCETVAAAGLLSVTVPVAEGGSGGDARVEAEVVELLAGACGATWFVGTQHRTPQQLALGGPRGVPEGTVRTGPAAARYRAGLGTAAERAGIAIAHLRRPGPPAVTAEPHGSGWRLRGHSDWCTGWGLTDLVMIGATTPDDRYLFVLVPARETAGLRAGDPLPLSVMGGTRTVSVEFDDLVVPGDAVLADVDGAPYRALDAARTANAHPASIGLLRRVLTELGRLGRERARPEASELAATLTVDAARYRDEAYALLTQVPVGERVAERTALRGELAALTVRAAQGLVAARSGSALLASSPEQRWAREAMFFLVQAQTVPVRAAQLAALGRS